MRKRFEKETFVVGLEEVQIYPVGDNDVLAYGNL